MTPERWDRMKEIFASVSNLSGEDRESALALACAGDPELKSELRQLLSQHDDMGRFLDGASASGFSGRLATDFILAERYRIVRFIGAGGMGDVYEAVDTELKGCIAIKIIRSHAIWDERSLERFRREVQLARHVTHGNVCRVFDIGHHRQAGEEIIFLTMELVPGETLAARMERTGRISQQEALVIARELCAALGAAHQAGVLHRDFKPGNVMLIGSGEKTHAVVMDFGVARWLGDGSTSASMPSTEGGIFGTPAYMSPEQIQGKGLSVASDVYSLGLVLYEMATGTRPFREQSLWGEALKRLTLDPPEPRATIFDLDPAWNRTIMRCLSRDPSRRYSSTHEVAAALQGASTEGGVRQHPRIAAFAAFVILVSIGAIFVLRNRIFGPSLPAEKHIAVLPFKFEGGDPANQARAYGLSESLTEDLSRLPGLGASTWVVPWRAVRDRPAGDESHAGSSLGANLLVTGELELRNGGLHLSTKIEDAGSLKTLRSEVIEVPEASITSMEDKLVERVAAMLRLPAPTASHQLSQIHDPPAPGAYEFYQEGKGYLQRKTAEDNDQAIILFERAVEKDPKFALAIASLAVAYEWRYRNTKDIQWLEKARAVSGHAMSLDDKLSTAHVASGLVLEDSGDLQGAVRALEEAKSLDPANEEVRNLLSVAYDQAGKLLEAETSLKEAVNRSPANWVCYNDLAAFYYRHQQYALAEPLFRAATELAPGNPKAFYNLGGVYAVQGKNKEAEAILLQAIAIKPAAGAYSNLGTVLRSEGRYADSAAMLEKAVELVPNDYRLWQNLGNAYVLADNREQADKAYHRAVEEIQRALALSPRDNQLLEALALNYANLRQKNNAMLALDKLSGSSAQTSDVLFNSALVYELVGERAHALSALQAAVRAGLPETRIQATSTFDRLRADARYNSVVAVQVRLSK